MCIECRMTPCHSMCPNSEYPRRIFICSECGHDICEGEDYLDYLGEQLCNSCVEELTKEAVYEAD